MSNLQDAIKAALVKKRPGGRGVSINEVLGRCGASMHGGGPWRLEDLSAALEAELKGAVEESRPPPLWIHPPVTITDVDLERSSCTVDSQPEAAPPMAESRAVLDDAFRDAESILASAEAAPEPTKPRRRRGKKPSVE